MLAPKAGSDPISKLKRTLAPKTMAWLLSMTERTQAAQRSPPSSLAGPPDAVASSWSGGHSDLLATNKMLFTCEIRR